MVQWKPVYTNNFFAAEKNPINDKATVNEKLVSAPKMLA